MENHNIKAGDDIVCKFVAEKVEVGENGVFTATITTSDVDRDGDVVLPDGIAAKNYMSNPVVLWSHNQHEPPIGKALGLTRNKNSIDAKFKFADRPENAQGEWKPDTIKSLVQQGIIKGVSIGFRVTENPRVPTKKDQEAFGDSVQQVIQKTELLEFSLCSLPCNPQALVTGISKCMKDKRFSKSMAAEILDIDEKLFEAAQDISTKDLSKEDTTETQEDTLKVEINHVIKATTPPVHDNCRCSIINGVWTLGDSESGPCDVCKALAAAYNKNITEVENKIVKMMTGETDGHSHSYELGDAETGETNDHKHKIIAGSEETGETNGHVHEVETEEDEGDMGVIQEPTPMEERATQAPKRKVIIIEDITAEDISKTVEIEMAKSRGKFFL